MSTDRDATRIVRSWLRDDEHESADHVLDAVLEQLDATPQRRAAWWPARRFPGMNKAIGFGLAAAAVVVLAILGIRFLAPPGVDVGGPGEPPIATESASRSPSATVRALPRSAGPPAALDAGTYVTPEGFEPAASVTVPDGWYGAAGSTGFGVLQGLDEVNQRSEGAEMYVDVISMPYGEAVAAFQELEGLTHEQDPETGMIGGYGATTFHARATGGPVLLDPIAPGLDISSDSDRQIFVDVAGTTVLIRTGVFDEAARPELEDVLASLIFSE